MTKIKRFVVKPRNPKTMENGLATTKGNISFGGKTQKILTDESLAREIDYEHGLRGKRDVFVYQDERLEWHDANNKDTDGVNRLNGGHRYFFGADANYSRAWEEFERRRKSRETRMRRGRAEVSSVKKNS